MIKLGATTGRAYHLKVRRHGLKRPYKLLQTTAAFKSIPEKPKVKTFGEVYAGLVT
jgi:hypothetical protein